MVIGDKTGATVHSVHRMMNDRRRGLEQPASGSMKCECECHRVECFSTFRLSLEDYKYAQAHERYFVVAAGHARPNGVVVSKRRDFLVIEAKRASHEF